MRTVGWNILILSFVSIASAQPSKKCLSPPKYPNTRVMKKNPWKVSFKCAEDSTPVGGSSFRGDVKCVNGKWTELRLKCEKRSCGNAGDLPNGYFDYEGETFVGEKAYAICNRGYTLKGRKYIICKKNGWSGEVPSCEENKINGDAKSASDRKTNCSPPAVANSVQSRHVSVYQVRENVTFTCSPGFQLDGAEQVTCGPDGQWYPKLPQCLPSLDRNEPAPVDKEVGRCGAPGAVENAGPALKFLTITSFASGDKVYYTCNIGYAPSGGSRYRVCDNGKWTRLTLKCHRKTCGSAGEILNGQFMYDGVEFGDVATGVCDEGYILVGMATRTCMSNGWDGRVPVCEAVVCPDPPEVANAEWNGGMQESYAYRNVIRYQCRVGTLVGPREIWCTKDGTWNSPPPQCKEMTCPPPNVPNAYWMESHKNQFQYRDTISIECKREFSRSGPDSITCESDGKWSPSLPTCHERRYDYRGRSTYPRWPTYQNHQNY